MKYSEDRTFLQCTNCGKIYEVEGKWSADDLYIDNYCSCCGHNNRMLIVCDDIDDIYKYYDNTLDERYYIY